MRRFAGRAGLVTAALVAIASLGGIFDPAIYARETESWRTQGMAQDWVDLVVAAPWLAITALLTLRGSRRGALLLGGGFAYTAYSFVIYAFAVHFNWLFLVYVATLGLSVFGLVDLGRSFLGQPARTWLRPTAPRRLVADSMIAVSVLFACLWLGQIVPALVAGTPPPELEEVGLVTNPVHILDLAIVLPLLFVTGLLLRRGRDSGHVLAVIFLGFSVLMDLALLAMMVALGQHGMAVAFTAVTLYFATLLVLMLHR